MLLNGAHRRPEGQKAPFGRHRPKQTAHLQGKTSAGAATGPAAREPTCARRHGRPHFIVERNMITCPAVQPLVGTFVAGIVAFAGLAIWVEAAGTPDWDGRLLAAIAGGEALDEAALAVTYATDAIGVAASAAVLFAWLLLRQRRRADALFFAGVLVAAGSLIWLLKLAFDRPRPVEDAAGPIAGASFPSGHAMTSMAIVLALLLLARTQWGQAGIALAGGLLTVAIAWSRLELGAHFPSDVIAGWAVSLAVVSALALLVRTPRRRVSCWLSGRGKC
jgi:membrane-associated phospholipid phosphatase